MAGLQTIARLQANRAVGKQYTPISAVVCHRQKRYAPLSLVVCHRRKATTDAAAPLPFEQIPGNRSLPVIGTIRPSSRKQFRGKIHERILGQVREFGPIVREQAGPTRIVLASDVGAIEKIHRHEGKFPKRFGFEHWLEWRKKNGKQPGILTIATDADKWKRMRTVLDKQMMRPVNVAEYTQNFNDTAGDLVARIRKLRDAGGKVATIDNELFNWSLESISTVLYEARLGCLSDDRDPEMQSFVDAVNAMFKYSEPLSNIPVIVAKLLARKEVKKHDQAWDTIFTVTERLIDEKLNEIEKQVESGEEPSGFLAGILAKQKLSKEELYSNISELMAAAVDTTSNTVQFGLDLLAHHPEVQEKLYDEIMRVVGRGDPTNSHMQELPYLRGFIREVQRHYPTAFGATRILDEDIVLLNYVVPAGTLIITLQFVTGRNPEYFSEPEKIKPERWFRDSAEKQKINPFSALPFGYGHRGCIGRRIAELEMYSLFAKISQNFSLKSESGKAVPMATRMLLVPEYPVDVQFIDRN